MPRKLTKEMLEKADDLLKKGAASGLTVTKVAKMLGVTYDLLYANGIKAENYGIIIKKVTPEIEQKIKDLQQKGYSSYAIAKEVKIAPSNAWRYMIKKL